MGLTIKISSLFKKNKLGLIYKEIHKNNTKYFKITIRFKIENKMKL